MNNLKNLVRWSAGLRSAAFISGFASLAYSLLIFATVKELVANDPNAPTSTASLARDIFGAASFAGNAWFIVSLIGFTFHSTKFLRGRTGKLGWKPGWAIGAWFVPFAYLVVPYLMLRAICDAVKPVDAPSTRGKLMSFWIVWMGILLAGNASSLVIQMYSNLAFNGWLVYAGIQAFLIVPMMQARTYFKQLELDIVNLQDPTVVNYDLKADGW